MGSTCSSHLEFASRKISAGGLTGGTDALFTCNIGEGSWSFNPADVTWQYTELRRNKAGEVARRPLIGVLRRRTNHSELRHILASAVETFNKRQSKVKGF